MYAELATVSNPGVPIDSVETGIPFTIDILMENDYGMMPDISFSFVFYGTGGITYLNHYDIGGSYMNGSLLTLNDWDSLWDVGNSWTADGWDIVEPDSIYWTGSSATGWPTTEGPVKYVQFGFRVVDLSTGQICVDSISISGSQEWLFEDPDFAFNGPYCWTIYNCSQSVCGDADNGGSWNILDATFLINYLYRNGPLPPCYCVGNADGNTLINILDIGFIINFLFMGGPIPSGCCP